MITIINTATDEVINADKEFRNYFQVSSKKWVLGSLYPTTRKLQKPFWKRIEEVEHRLRAIVNIKGS